MTRNGTPLSGVPFRHRESVSPIVAAPWPAAPARNLIHV
jgi:hypothetical protein